MVLSEAEVRAPLGQMEGRQALMARILFKTVLASRDLPLVRRILAAIGAFLLRKGIVLRSIRPRTWLRSRAPVTEVSRQGTVQRGAVAPAWTPTSKPRPCAACRFVRTGAGPDREGSEALTLRCAKRWKRLLPGAPKGLLVA